MLLLVMVMHRQQMLATHLNQVQKGFECMVISMNNVKTGSSTFTAPLQNIDVQQHVNSKINTLSHLHNYFPRTMINWMNHFTTQLQNLDVQ